MTITEALSSLPALTWDGLATAYRLCAERALAGRSRSAVSRACNDRDRVAAEVSRRGLVVRRVNADRWDQAAQYVVGRPSDFQPIQETR